jgi:hypothetical protein
MEVSNGKQRQKECKEAQEANRKEAGSQEDIGMLRRAKPF